MVTTALLVRCGNIAYQEFLVLQGSVMQTNREHFQKLLWTFCKHKDAVREWEVLGNQRLVMHFLSEFIY
jgi:hypothetical protein